MMRAILTREWSVAPEGHTVVTFPAGAVVTGDLARRAVECGVAAFDPREDAPKIAAPTETKRRRKVRK